MEMVAFLSVSKVGIFSFRKSGSQFSKTKEYSLTAGFTHLFFISAFWFYKYFLKIT